MQGIILTGGQGSRLRPLTDNTNKHLLDICGWPMIHYSLSIFVSAGVRDITLVSNSWHLDKFKEYLGNDYNGRFDSIQFISQTDEKPGIAGSIQHVPEENRRGPYMLVLADNIIGGSVSEFRTRFDQNPDKALIFLTEVQSPEAFGVAHVEDGHLLYIEEKPESPDSHCAITGIYFFPSDLFEIASRVRPSRRGEYEITDVLAQYLQDDRLEYCYLPFWWIDAGTHDALDLARRRICEKS